MDGIGGAASSKDALDHCLHPGVFTDAHNSPPPPGRDRACDRAPARAGDRARARARDRARVRSHVGSKPQLL
eukprot:1743915-Lingulodinium_polyedra.AAC.1